MYVCVYIHITDAIENQISITYINRENNKNRAFIIHIYIIIYA